MDTDALKQSIENDPFQRYPTIFQAWLEGKPETQRDYQTFDELFESRRPGLYYAFVKQSQMERFCDFIERSDKNRWLIASQFMMIKLGALARYNYLGTDIVVYTDSRYSRRELHFLPHPVSIMEVGMTSWDDEDYRPRPLEPINPKSLVKA